MNKEIIPELEQQHKVLVDCINEAVSVLRSINNNISEVLDFQRIINRNLQELKDHFDHRR